MCKIANVSKSGYYKWVKTKNQISLQEVLEIVYIKEIFNRKNGAYGIRTIKMKLEHEYGIVMNRKKISRIMKEQNLITKTRKQKSYGRFRILGDRMYCENLVQQNFKNRNPFEVFGIDITYLKCNGKFSYLCGLIDVKTTEIISYTLSRNLSMGFVIETIKKGLSSLTEQELKNLIVHSDRGVHFTSNQYKEELQNYGVKQSMSLPGNPKDNAVIESFFGHFKDEINLKKIKSFDELVEIVDDYMYDYNNYRSQWSKNKMTPIQYRNFLVA